MTSPFAGVGRVFTTALGGPVTYTPLNGTPREIVAILRTQAKVVRFDGDGVPVESYMPMLSVSRDDVTAPRVGDRVSSNGSAYTVRSIQAARHGMIRLVLEAD